MKDGGLIPSNLLAYWNSVPFSMPYGFSGKMPQGISIAIIYVSSTLLMLLGFVRNGSRTQASPASGVGCRVDAKCPFNCVCIWF
jgi:hypothetical protein